jgi:hypothetical protein
VAALNPPGYLLAGEGQRHIPRWSIVFLRACYDRKHRSLLPNLKWRIETMNDLIQLTDAEIAGVSGGLFNQNNIAVIRQFALAVNTGAVSSGNANGGAGGAGGGILSRGGDGGAGGLSAAAGAEANNAAEVNQLNAQHIG